MYAKGGQRVLKAELRTAEVDPRLKKNKTEIAVSEKTDTVAIFKISLPQQMSFGL